MKDRKAFLSSFSQKEKKKPKCPTPTIGGCGAGGIKGCACIMDAPSFSIIPIWPWKAHRTTLSFCSLCYFFFFFFKRLIRVLLNQSKRICIYNIYLLNWQRKSQGKPREREKEKQQQLTSGVTLTLLQNIKTRKRCDYFVQALTIWVW